ncbi:hypothetical protein GCM10027091_46390 [Streptomyces daliensis]
MAAFGDEPLSGATESRHACFASFSMTAVTQALTAEGTVDRPPACALEPSPDGASGLSEVLPEGEGLLLCEAEEVSEPPPEHAAISGAAASNVAAAAQPMALLPGSGRAMTFCSSSFGSRRPS